MAADGSWVGSTGGGSGGGGGGGRRHGAIQPPTTHGLGFGGTATVESNPPPSGDTDELEAFLASLEGDGVVAAAAPQPSHFVPASMRTGGARPPPLVAAGPAAPDVQPLPAPPTDEDDVGALDEEGEFTRLRDSRLGRFGGAGGGGGGQADSGTVQSAREAALQDLHLRQQRQAAREFSSRFVTAAAPAPGADAIALVQLAAAVPAGARPASTGVPLDSGSDVAVGQKRRRWDMGVDAALPAPSAGGDGSIGAHVGDPHMLAASAVVGVLPPPRTSRFGPPAPVTPAGVPADAVPPSLASAVLALQARVSALAPPPVPAKPASRALYVPGVRY
jgi:hypothetical protein